MVVIDGFLNFYIFLKSCRTGKY